MFTQNYFITGRWSKLRAETIKLWGLLKAFSKIFVLFQIPEHEFVRKFIGLWAKFAKHISDNCGRLKNVVLLFTICSKIFDVSWRGFDCYWIRFSPRKDKFINFHESVISKQWWKKKPQAELITAMRHVAVAESFANWKLSKTNRKQFLLLAFSKKTNLNATWSLELRRLTKVRKMKFLMERATLTHQHQKYFAE